MTHHPVIRRNSGYCHCCRNEVIFESTHDWLRDYYKCSVCGSIPRQRHLQYILDKYFQGWDGLAIHESSPSADFIRRYSGDNYSSSQYFPEVPLGSYHQNIRCENLEILTFPENHFDIFITQDVFEHLFSPATAAREIMRVLKPGGVHVFTAPKHGFLKFSRCRATLRDGNVVHLEEAQYHGNPIGDGRSLVTWDYGSDFEFLLQEWCGFPTVTYVTRDPSIGIDGEYLEVFVTRKI